MIQLVNDKSVLVALLLCAVTFGTIGYALGSATLSAYTTREDLE